MSDTSKVVILLEVASSLQPNGTPAFGTYERVAMKHRLKRQLVHALWTKHGSAVKLAAASPPIKLDELAVAVRSKRVKRCGRKVPDVKAIQRHVASLEHEDRTTVRAAAFNLGIPRSTL